MRVLALQLGQWQVACQPADGGRLGVLRFDGQDLLTGAPATFRPPAGDCGEYERRPVYGYDDCFPTVDPCPLLGVTDVELRDHGELCWLPWEVRAEAGRLVCRTRSPLWPKLEFRRELAFDGGTLRWRFEVANGDDVAVPFLHVMHALLPLEHIRDVQLPPFAHAVFEPTGLPAPCATPQECRAMLLGQPRGTATMLLLRGVADGQAGVTFASGLTLTIGFPAALFPTLGIWWNHAGYPDEDGCRRCECALEPIPGAWSSLARSQADGTGLVALPGERRTWEIIWRVENG